MPSADEIKKYVTDEIAQTIVDLAAHGGIAYWATEPTKEEFAGLPEGKKWTIVEGQDDTDWGGEREVDEVFYLNPDDIREAYAALLDPNQGHVDREIRRGIVTSWEDRDDEVGIETTALDAGVADHIIQLAALGEIRYG
ncbi:hypothetical protein OG824_13485 [Streptomyces prunicolor]|uniref:hypothetical protein n=1 Tax=Streptomyces prunicolor TaxID=67348 RepID=UPI00225A6482|nr:hypothetical protein [Streptomyces prunicolor]MCX5236214.1 hypothetical protein [Streptomyces prunicolor]